MNVVGIIAEYNPFHAGHAYHIQKAKEITGAKFAVVIMNGDFVQRGEPAIYDKYTRTRQALEGGADMVFELPLRFGISSAGDFAYGGVLALHSLGFADALCFGSEIGAITPLQEIASYLKEEPAIFQSSLQALLKKGLSYPASRSMALNQAGRFNESILKNPNNTLGIEYCLALLTLSSTIRPFTIQRIGEDYHGNTADTLYPSATTLRQHIYQSPSPHLHCDDLSAALGYALLSCNDLTHYKDINADLADRLSRFIPNFTTFSSLVDTVYNPSLTKSRIRRGLLQCLLHLKSTDTSLPYLRLLGMKKEASSLLGNKEKASCKIISRLSTDAQELSSQAHSLLEQDILASNLYRQTWNRKYGTSLPNEYQHSPIVLK